MCVFTLQTIKVTVTSPNATVANPVLVSVYQLREVTSWQIPFVDKELVSVGVFIRMCIYSVCVCVQIMFVELSI